MGMSFRLFVLAGPLWWACLFVCLFVSLCHGDMMDPKLVPLFKKQEFLSTFSEDDFRDKVIRPLYLLKGLKHGKDICGNDEDGKDCYLWGEDAVRGQILYVVQTKKGHLKMSSKAQDNVTSVTAQVRTALSTPVKNSATRQSLFPDYVILAVSGEINKKAQGYITDEIKDRRIIFRGSDELIPEIDKHMPELWFGIDVKRLPYIRRLRDQLINQSDTIDVSQLGVGVGVAAPITDDTFVQLYLQHYKVKPTRVRGRVESELDLEEIRVQDALKRGETVILITGDAGSGKTTSLRRLAMILVQQALQSPNVSPLPVFISATEIASNERRLVEVAAEVTQRLTMEGAPAFSADDLVAGNLVLLIDAFDEVASAHERETFLDRLADFTRDYAKCRVIMTSRDHPAVRQAMQRIIFTRFSISPISLQQAQKMIERLSRGKSLDSETTQEILRRLDNIHGLELNPLLVTVFVATTDYARTDIPANITELFKKFTELMLGRWDQSKGISQQYQAQVKDFLLCRIGFTIHSRRHVSISLHECRDIIVNDLKDRGLEADIDVLFDEIVHRSGLVRVEDDRLSFRHLLLQEFFAGRGVPSLEFLATSVSDYWWMRATVFYFGERPGDYNSLAYVQKSLGQLGGIDLFQAAVALGMVVQACYLTKTEDKSVAMEWVVTSMAKTIHACLDFYGPPRGDYDSYRVVLYYVYGRDAVAGKIIGDVADKIRTAKVLQGKDRDLEDLFCFWCIAGLIESRQLEMANEMIQEFKPADQRLLLALDLGSFYVERSHVTTAAQKRIAKAIRTRIAPKIPHLRSEILKEFKGIVLEMRKDVVRALDAPKQ
jgi:hypothetical protein